MRDREGKRGKKKKKKVRKSRENTKVRGGRGERGKGGSLLFLFSLFLFLSHWGGERCEWLGAFQTSFSCATVYSCFYLCDGVVSLGAEMCHLVQLVPALQKNQQAFCWISLRMQEGRKQFSDWLQVEATIERSHPLPFPPDYLLSFFQINI